MAIKDQGLRLLHQTTEQKVIEILWPDWSVSETLTCQKCFLKHVGFGGRAAPASTCESPLAFVQTQLGAADDGLDEDVVRLAPGDLLARQARQSLAVALLANRR